MRKDRRRERDIIDELTWRGLIAQSTDLDALAADVARPPITVYAGFDPTAPSLHAGHLVPLLTLRGSSSAVTGRSCWPAVRPG